MTDTTQITDIALRESESALAKLKLEGKISNFLIKGVEHKSGMKKRNSEIPDHMICANVSISFSDGSRLLKPICLGRGDTPEEAKNNFIKEVIDI